MNEENPINSTEVPGLPVLKVECKIFDARLREDEYKPAYGSAAAAGMDLRACIMEPMYIAPGETKMIPTGLAIYLANSSFAAMLLPRSGLGAKHGVVLGNLVGLIDPDYQGQMMIACWNRNHSETISIHPMDRISQMIVVPVLHLELNEVEEFVATERNHQGFGSTGKQ